MVANHLSEQQLQRTHDLELRANRAKRLRDVQWILEREFGQVRCLSAVYGLLHRRGYSLLSPRPQHPQADLAAQEEFKERFRSRLEEIQTQYPDQRIEVWHEGEARFGQQGTLTRVWARTGSRPRAICQMQDGYIYVLAATCGEADQAEGLIAPRLDVDIVNLFLEQLSKRLQPYV
ncbi:MAG: winged helix-turn-helix domain-containing protein [Planctomycetes bacterium]|nr:winged helix-turn-helix domain-containing protein [Planctomycetota bacterium]